MLQIIAKYRMSTSRPNEACCFHLEVLDINFNSDYKVCAYIVKHSYRLGGTLFTPSSCTLHTPYRCMYNWMINFHCTTWRWPTFVAETCSCALQWFIVFMEWVYCTLCGQNAVFDIQADGSCSYCCALRNWSYFQLLGRAHAEESVKHNAAEIS